MRNAFQKLLLAVLALLAALPLQAHAAGTLKPTSSSDADIGLTDHHVRVVINNGFAQTEVTQNFHNPNPHDLEAIYSFPLPKSASLSEMTIFAGETRLDGEVVAKDKAEQIYEEEKQTGNNAGLASKNDYQSFEFRVFPVPAGGDTTVRFVYYQPLEIDTGTGRYVYPLEEGGTDEIAKSFWLQNDKVDNSFSADFTLKSAWPVTGVRVPGFENSTSVTKENELSYHIQIQQQGGALNKDLVLYYRLQDNLPGRVEVIPYRASPDKPGTFMMVVTPGLDLQPLANGADYVFVLDVSGSMEGKLATLARGVAQAIGELHPQDRFRVVTFSDSAREIIAWTPATPQNVQSAIRRVEQLKTEGSTNLYEGLEKGLDDLGADRVTSLILVTDGVANQGLVNPKDFRKLLQQYDIRIFGFLMGNSGNWPLMRLIAETSGGFYSAVSNSDDILGQILLAKGKITHESLHHASFKFHGVDVFDTTGEAPGKIYQGQQLVLFGRYKEAGTAKLELHAALSGQDKLYTTTVQFPETDTGNPEIERLWALAKIEEIQRLEMAGLAEPDEAEDAIRDLGLTYQLVTDQTSMVVLSDDAFARRGIERRNKARVALEHQAQAARGNQPVRNYRADQGQPMFKHNAPSTLGGGAVGPAFGLFTLGLLLVASGRGRRDDEI